MLSLILFGFVGLLLNGWLTVPRCLNNMTGLNIAAKKPVSPFGIGEPALVEL